VKFSRAVDTLTVHIEREDVCNVAIIILCFKGSVGVLGARAAVLMAFQVYERLHLPTRKVHLTCSSYLTALSLRVAQI